MSNTGSNFDYGIENTREQENKNKVNKTQTSVNTSGVNEPTGCGCGCFWLIAIFLILAAAGASISTVGVSNDFDVRSTVERSPLDSSLVTESPYYDDNLGWFNNPNVLVRGMKEFYSKTGVQPVLLVDDDINNHISPSEAQLEAFSKDLYNRLFDDQGHILVIYLDKVQEDIIYIYCGDDAKTVFDEEAISMLEHNIRYELEKDSELSEEEKFSKAFTDTAEDIMNVAGNLWNQIFITLGVIVIGLIMAGKIYSYYRKDVIKKQTTNVQSNGNTSNQTVVESAIENTLIENYVKEKPTEPPILQETSINVNLEKKPKDRVINKAGENIIECTGCGAINRVKNDSVVECAYCGTPLKG